MLNQGAEARIYIDKYDGVQCLVKERFVKKYRHPDLDTQISKERIRAETKAIKRCLQAEILVPQIFNVDMEGRKIFMEYFAKSLTCKEYINKYLISESLETKDALSKLCQDIGKLIAKLHKNNIIHGDLTTSNLLINPTNESVLNGYDLIPIDFGLSHYSQSEEDKAVDIYVLERALLSTHSDLPNLFDSILNAYKSIDIEQSRKVVSKFEEVRARGRKRTMIG